MCKSRFLPYKLIVTQIILLIITFLLLKFKDVVEFCEKMANLGKIVIVAALDGTYQRKVYDYIYHGFVIDRLQSVNIERRLATYYI